MRSLREKGRRRRERIGELFVDVVAKAKRAGFVMEKGYKGIVESEHTFPVIEKRHKDPCEKVQQRIATAVSGSGSLLAPEDRHW